MKTKPVVENFIEISGRDIPVGSLTEAERKKVENMLTETIMKTAGFKRKQE